MKTMVNTAFEARKQALQSWTREQIIAAWQKATKETKVPSGTKVQILIEDILREEFPSEGRDAN